MNFIEVYDEGIHDEILVDIDKISFVAINMDKSTDNYHVALSCGRSLWVPEKDHKRILCALTVDPLFISPK